ncbi:DNA polymerase IV [Ureaplasma sp. ES3154-GEN]|uniref:Y-family DNA polymerase n=1 Tax=Ureaplasma sp. ES3154-GEN TaxID=2984844 RepID=UPI0021E8227E|nr:DNA polymerase IV [Ureaplasma sp. ES3154-GEN]MCV3743423.1 DNA polymerase IV [Ureaplasma sp. ES3154-GEN]
MSKIIMHIDIDAFFAQASIINQHKDRNFPTVVSNMRSRHQIIATSNYAARKYKIHSAMHLGTARKLFPDLLVLKPDYDLYDRLSKHFQQIAYQYSSKVYIYSVDELFIDVTNLIPRYHNNINFLILDIKKRIKQSINLEVSIGVSVNFLLAKIATDLNKPNGHTVLLDKNSIRKQIEPLLVSDVPYIGNKSSILLNKEKIFTVKDLLDQNNQQKVYAILGSNYYNLISNLTGSYDVDLINFTTREHTISRSISVNPTDDEKHIKQIMLNLFNDLYQQLISHNYVVRVVSFYIKNKNYEQHSQQAKMPYYTNDRTVLLHYLLKLFSKLYNEQILTLVGVAFADVLYADEEAQQTHLF